jgi:hypothetical protein
VLSCRRGRGRFLFVRLTGGCGCGVEALGSRTATGGRVIGSRFVDAGEDVAGGRSATGCEVEALLASRTATGGRVIGTPFAGAGDNTAAPATAEVDVDGRGKRDKGWLLNTGIRMGTGRRGRVWGVVNKKGEGLSEGLVE